MRIRPVADSDLASMRALTGDWLREVVGEGLERAVEERAALAQAAVAGASGLAFLVADDRGEVVGVAGLSLSAPDELRQHAADAEVFSVFVRRDRVGEGIGTALVDAIEDEARRHGATHLVVVSGPHHRKLGYPFWTGRYGEPVQIDADFFAPGAERRVWRATL